MKSVWGGVKHGRPPGWDLEAEAVERARRPVQGAWCWYGPRRSGDALADKDVAPKW